MFNRLVEFQFNLVKFEINTSTFINLNVKTETGPRPANKIGNLQHSCLTDQNVKIILKYISIQTQVNECKIVIKSIYTQFNTYLVIYKSSEH